jgi:hypothetical protein
MSASGPKTAVRCYIPQSVHTKGLALLRIYANLSYTQATALNRAPDQAAAFAANLVRRRILNMFRSSMFHGLILKDIVAELYRQAAKLYSKTVAPNYS